MHQFSPVHVHAVRGLSPVCRGQAFLPRLLSLFLAYVASCVYVLLHLDVRTPRTGACCITHLPCSAGVLLFQRLPPSLPELLHVHTNMRHIDCTLLTGSVIFFRWAAHANLHTCHGCHTFPFHIVYMLRVFAKFFSLSPCGLLLNPLSVRFCAHT
jgi:hypothetical protein